MRKKKVKALPFLTSHRDLTASVFEPQNPEQVKAN